MGEKRTEEGKITIGSATCYMQEWDGTYDQFEKIDRAWLDAICVDDNRFAYTKGGATATYTKESNTVQDDLGLIRKTVFTTDEFNLKLGVIGQNGLTMARMESTARVSEKDGIRTVKIGGTGNDNGKLYVIVLHHVDKTDGDCWWILVGKNKAGFEMSYSAEDPSKLEPEFAASSCDKDGTLAIFIEEIGAGSEVAAG